MHAIIYQDSTRREHCVRAELVLVAAWRVDAAVAVAAVAVAAAAAAAAAAAVCA